MRILFDFLFQDSFDYSSVLDLVVDMQPVDIDERAGQLKTSAKVCCLILPSSFNLYPFSILAPFEHFEKAA